MRPSEDPGHSTGAVHPAGGGSDEAPEPDDLPDPHEPPDSDQPAAGVDDQVPVTAGHGAHRAVVADAAPAPVVRQPEPPRVRRPEPLPRSRASTPPTRPGPLPSAVATRTPAPAPPVLAPPPLAPPLRPSVTAGDVAALLLISLGAFVAPIVAPVLGLLLLWRSRGWQRPDKGAVTAVVALPIVAALGVVAVSWFLRVWRF